MWRSGGEDEKVLRAVPPHKLRRRFPVGSTVEVWGEDVLLSVALRKTLVPFAITFVEIAQAKIPSVRCGFAQPTASAKSFHLLS